MTERVRPTAQAEADIERIFERLSRRSPEGRGVENRNLGLEEMGPRA